LPSSAELNTLLSNESGLFTRRCCRVIKKYMRNVG
jgi:hypothetical protein